jgi:hypothetical protein
MPGVGLTDPQTRALEALHTMCVLESRATDAVASPRQVARLLWPKSPSWRKRSSRGVAGQTMPMKAARMLWSLKRQGVAYTTGAKWGVTEQGLRVLNTVPQTLPIPDITRTSAARQAPGDN